MAFQERGGNTQEGQVSKRESAFQERAGFSREVAF